MTGPLPEGYYLEDFRAVLGEVAARHGELLRAEERAALARFDRLPLAAQRLLVRLLSRKGPWFRLDGLRYREIEEPGSAVEALRAAGFVACEAALEELLPLLTRADLLQLLDRSAGKGTRRDALLRQLLEGHAEAELVDRLREFLRPLRLADEGLWRTVFLLFFGNFEQDLSSFVVAAIGNVRFEDYRLDPGARVFADRADVDYLLALRGLRERLERGAGPEALETVTAEALAMEAHPGVRQQRRFHGLLNQLGQAWERAGNLERAMDCYNRSERPPAAERRVRIAAARGALATACRMAMALAEAPRDVTEARFARGFLARMRHRHPSAAQWTEAHPAPQPVPVRRLEAPVRAGVAVEEVALLEARDGGWDGFFAENLLWRGLFGLALWEELFADIPGAFLHRFQWAPLDLGSPEFFDRRRGRIESRLALLEACVDPAIALLETFDRKEGIANSFVDWRHLRRDMVAAAAPRVGGRVLAAVCAHMARNPLGFDSGFPDLFLFRPDSLEWRLWEVKGPHDRLRPEQEDWLQRFRALGADAEVARLG